MKKMMFYLVLLALMAACKKTPSVFVDCNSPTNNAGLAQKILEGRWEWAYEKVQTRGFPVEYLTPKEKGYTKQMLFNTNSKVYLYKNKSDEKYLQYRITSRKEFTSPNDSILNVLVFETNDKKIIDVLDFKICTDTLYISVTNHSYEAWTKQ